MEFATGALGTLLPKLAQLLKDEYNLQKGAKKNVEFLTRELESVQAALRNVGEVPREQLNEQVKIWARDARELSYDMEDIVDTFLVRVQGPEAPSKRSAKRFVKKMKHIFTKVTARREIGQEIKDVKERVEEVARRRDRYKVDVAVPAKASLDPRIAALYNKVGDLVGIEEARGELIMRLAKGDDKSAQQRIVSVVGFGGLGKTTLATAAYDELKGKFDCTAFVPVGRNPDLKKVLKAISVDLGMYIDFELLDERQMINKLREFLENKRYFLVIDDVWETESWDIIKLAFVENNKSSRIITTTRNHEVAGKAGEVYKLQPLSDDNSRKLFLARIFGDESKSSEHQVDDEAFDKILRKCGGIPLAIITMASLLVGKTMDEWSEVHRSIGFANKENQQVENTEKIISFSYYDLPSHLRTCLLYLSLFPEDYFIEKSTLVWMWIAEGFVQEKQEMSSFKIGEGYFNELVNRSMIQMVDSREDGEGTMVCGCQVHDMVLDLIRSISSEENFVTVLGNNNELRGIVRRLALQYEGTLKAAVDMQLVRSFISWQWDSDKWISLSSFKVVRVLALHRNQDHLQVPVRNLPHLRYLQLRVRSFELPAQEMGCLKFLRTLDVYVTGYEKCDLEDINFVCPLTKLPSVRPLTEMLCLRIRGWVNTVPDGIGKLTSLEELEMRYGGPEREAWRRFVKELCSLRELRLLRLDVSEVEDGIVLQSLRNLQKLEVLSLTTVLPPSGVADAAAWGADVCLLSRRLRHLSLTGIRFSRLPPFCCINPSRLPHLSHLSLRVVAMDEQDLRNLGGLPQLRFLHLDVHSITAEVDCNNSRTDDDGCCLFQNLILCSIQSRVVRLLLPSQEGSSSSVSFCMLNVEASMRLGSERADSVCKAAGVAPTLMPSVQELSFLIYLKEFIEDGNQDQDRVSLAMEYFASLQDVSVSIDTNDYVYRDDADEEQVKAALRHAVDVHPNRPTLRTRGTLLTRMEWWRQRRESLR